MNLAPSSCVLVRSTNWLGDVMISLPALRAVRERFADGYLAVHVRERLAEILCGLSWVDEVIPFEAPRGPADIGARRKAIAPIRGGKFDLAILFPNSFDAALWPFLARIPRRLGYARNGRGMLLTDRVAATREILVQHQVRYYLNLLRPLGVESAPERVHLETSPQARLEADAILADLRGNGPRVALAAGAAYGPAKEWPEGHYARLARWLAERHGARIVLVGAPDEKAKCERIAAALTDLPGGPPLVTAGRTSVASLAALLSRCDGFVGNDSGAMHMAGVVGIPTVAIFGSTDPARTYPLGPLTGVVQRPIECSPCSKRTCPYGHYRCLTEIEPDMVAEKLCALGAFDGSRA